MHQAEQYHVDRLDWDEKKAYVHQVDVDYYTDANLAVTIKALDVLKEAAEVGLRDALRRGDDGREGDDLQEDQAAHPREPGLG